MFKNGWISSNVLGGSEVTLKSSAVCSGKVQKAMAKQGKHLIKKMILFKSVSNGHKDPAGLLYITDSWLQIRKTSEAPYNGMKSWEACERIQ